MAYPHIQMGVTHASLRHIRRTAKRSTSTPARRRVRRPVLDAPTSRAASARAARKDSSVDALRSFARAQHGRGPQSSLRAGSKLKINAPARERPAHWGEVQTTTSPRSTPRKMTTKQTVTTLGKIILEQDTSTKLPMFSPSSPQHDRPLSNCSAADIRRRAPKARPASIRCSRPMPLVSTTEGGSGLAEGPHERPHRPARRSPDLPATGNAGGPPPGHRAVAEQVAPLMTNSRGTTWGRRRALQQEEMLTAGATRLSADVGNVDGLLADRLPPRTHAPRRRARALDYVATVVFVDSAADYAKAQKLSNPVPWAQSPARLHRTTSRCLRYIPHRFKDFAGVLTMNTTNATRGAGSFVSLSSFRDAGRRLLRLSLSRDARRRPIHLSLFRDAGRGLLRSQRPMRGALGPRGLGDDRWRSVRWTRVCGRVGRRARRPLSAKAGRAVKAAESALRQDGRSRRRGECGPRPRASSTGLPRAARRVVATGHSLITMPAALDGGGEGSDSRRESGCRVVWARPVNGERGRPEALAAGGPIASGNAGTA